jgi:exportin-7
VPPPGTAPFVALALPFMSKSHSSLGAVVYSGQSLTAHRKISVLFRDKSLLFVFQMALTTLRQILNKQIQVTTAAEDEKIRKYALSLAKNCLSFDSMGAALEELSDDVQNIQV